MLRYTRTGRFSKTQDKYNNGSIEDVIGNRHDIVNANVEVLESIGVPIIKLDMEDEADMDEAISFLRDKAAT